METINYGRCPCGGLFEARYVEVSMSINGTTKVWPNVPQGACPQCGSRVYKAHVLERLEALMATTSTR
jgi:YgiT-type zinc finger domain-containing protein